MSSTKIVAPKCHDQINLGGWVYNAPRKFLRKIMHGLDPDPLLTMHPPAATEDGQRVEITGTRYLGSYSWLKARKPIILVPGAPRIWTHRQTPFTLPPDFGYQACDFNAHRLPPYPLLPIFIAIDTFDWASADVVADSGQRRDFRMDLQLAGSKTVLCTRWEPKVLMNANPGGYGRNFERMHTRPAPGCENTTSHHRVITYDLAGMKMVVRAEVDACLPDLDGKAAYAQEIPQSALVELTTKHESRDSRWSHKHMQMCISQTPNLIYGIHRNGVFNKVVKKGNPVDVHGHMEFKLRLLRRALENIQQLVVASGLRGRLTLIYEDKVLKVYQRNLENSLLPEEYLEMFQPKTSIFVDLLDSSQALSQVEATT
ncbi:uncharacterized protein EV420DRAFT_1647373 [Desarmillaria tabescens]|uniref:Rho-GAP domain-containing protein n=1 Tax=Armillaria tabescens TaxID=1929756 RepID=A0AA39JT69_ARMTA|nr:uncharacterized protein EV420DRAFT_1647373 [Desarmillaria tabescens]KAK0448476.1 hypothetical protein EV420DRAFT_1647373 [Desarmillaria tabescens]